MIVDAFHISLATAGLTVSVYAAGVMVGAPLLTTITGRIPRKRLILLIMTVFIVGNLLTAAAPNFTVLLLGRVVSALAHGIFMTVATVIAANVVPMNKRASAIAAMFTGLTVATVTGVPLGTFIGQHASWHMSFVTIALVGLIGLVADFILVPAGLPMPTQGKRGSLLRIAKQPTILLSLILTAIGYGASFPVYTYLTTILTKQGWAASASVLILIIYGIAVAVGNTVGGRLANENPLRALFMMFAALAVVLIAMLFGLSLQVIGLALILLLGLLAFMNVPGLQLFTMQATEKFLPDDVQMASALNISAFNVGVMAGSFVGGQLVEQVGLMSTPIAGIGMAVLAMLIIGVLAHREH